MARAARYGNVPPDVFEEMEWEWALEISRRVTRMHENDVKDEIEIRSSIAKAIIETIARRPTL